MKFVNGWWFTDGEQHMIEYMATIKENEYQPVHQREAVKHCTQFRTAVDIGAHIGLWSRHLVPKFERVIAFEPCAEFRECLVKNAPGIHTIQPVALGNEEAMVSLWVNPKHTAETRIDIVDRSALGIDPTNTGATQTIKDSKGTIPMHRLDSYGLLEVDFIKIDTEGFELEILKGARDTLINNDPVIIVEQKPRYVRPEDGPQAAVKFLIHELGYRVVGKVVDDWIMKKI